MRTLTAAAAARGFTALLDRVAEGETFVITRDGRPVARIEPERRTTGARILDFYAGHPGDPEFADDIEAASYYSRSSAARTGQ